MAGTKPYPLELRERAVRMVAEVRSNYESDWAAITAVAARLGIGTAETLRKWVRQAQVDDGQVEVRFRHARKRSRSQW